MQRLKWHYHKNAAGALYKQQCHISHVCSHSNSNNWHNHVRSSLKDAWNSRVFICRQNANTYDSAVLTYAGRALHCSQWQTSNFVIHSRSVTHVGCGRCTGCPPFSLLYRSSSGALHNFDIWYWYCQVPEDHARHHDFVYSVLIQTRWFRFLFTCESKYTGCTCRL